jgi:hypothetical protein
MLISGAIPFKNKKEKLAAWRDLKKEFGDSVRVVIKDGIMAYTCKVERGYI